MAFRRVRVVSGLFFLAVASLLPAAAQDARTVTEPTFPATCTTLAATQAIVSGEPTSETAFDTARIQSALSACGAGKAVELTTSGANNAFLIAPITIPSGVTLLIDGGATVFASRNPADYQIGTVSASQEQCGTVGTKGNGCNPLFNVNNGSTSTGSGIMGYGVINGRGGDKLLVGGVVSANSWWDLANQANTGSNAQNNPILMYFKKASNFTMYKITLMNSPMFHVKWQNASGFTAWDIKIVTPYSARNTDGIDPGDNVSNITIANSYISDGDDNVAVGASGTGNGASAISITNNHTYSGHGVSIGSYTSGGVSNMAVNTLFQSGNLQDTNSNGLRIKSSPDRGGLINNIQYTNVCIQNVRYPLVFNPTYNTTTGSLPPTMSNIGLHNITVSTSNTTDNFQLQGFSTTAPLGITFDNLQIVGPLNLTPMPKNANIQLGPGAVLPAALQTITGNNVTYTGNVTNPNEARYACPATAFPFIAGELYISTATATNLRTLAVGNGATFTLNAILEPVEAGSPTPTSSIQFYDGATQVGTAALSGNGTIASLTLSNQSSGAHTYTARYPTDSSYTVLNFGSVVVNVNAISTTTTMTATPASAVYGNAITLAATVAQSTNSTIPTGTVTFSNGTTVIGTAAVSGTTGIATLTTTTLPVGADSITASYGGTSTFAASDSTATPVTVTLTQAGTTTNFTPTPVSATYGASISLSSTVTSATTGTPTGSITYTDTTNNAVIGAMALTNGTAVLATSTLNAGVHQINASYSGDSNFSASNSSTAQVIIVSASTTTSVGFTATSLPVGSPVTILATLTPAGGTQTGTVVFHDGSATGTIIGSGSVASASASITVSNFAIGVHNIFGVYSGDGNYTGSTSQSTPLTVTQAASTTTLAASATTPSFGSSDTFTATISTSSGTTPTGTVNFMDGASTLASNVAVTTTVGVTTAVFSTATLSVGAHSVFAIYSGDTNMTGSTSPTVTVTVSAAPTSTTLAPPAAITYGTAAALSATVTNNIGGSPTGTVTFFDGATSLGSSPLTAGTASFSAPNLTGGTHAITAKYIGDGSFATSTSAPQTLTVNKAASTTAASANPATVGYTASTTLTATIAPTSATGTVTFAEGAMTLGSSNVSSGTATIAVATLSVGQHSIIATYSGDGNYATSASTSFTVTVTQAVSNTTLVASPTNPVFLTTVNFTATVPTGATGTVLFKDGGATIGTGTVSSSGGTSTATFAASALSGGVHMITAVYAGDTNYTTSTSTAATVTVSTAATATALGVTPSPAAFGATVTITATVTPSVATAETGTVTFRDGATVLGTGTLATNAGVTTASLTTSALGGGSHTLTASYAGDGNFAGSTSSSVTESVTPAVTATAIAASPATTTFGSSVVFTATVTPSLATPASGTVTFKDGVNVLGTATLSTTAGVTTATFTASALAGGAHAVTATYAGDGNYGGSASAAANVTISPATTTLALAATPATTTFGTNVTLTATLSSTAATGTVTFKEGATLVGTGTVTNGAATFSTATFSTATHTIVAIYSGDSNFAASTSLAATVTINPVTPTVVLTANPSSLTFGQSTTLSATLAPAAASGTVTFRDLATGALGQGTISNGVATFLATGLAGGAHTLQATYGGDTNDAAASSATLGVTVNPAATATALTVNPTTSIYGTSVTLTARITPTSGTGTVTFFNGAATLGTGTVTGGSATFISTTLPAGSYNVTAVYAGDANDATSTSAPAALTITKATVTAALGAAPTASTFGQTVTLTTTLSSTAAGGTVTFLDGNTVLGIGTVSTGVATYSTATLSGGSHTITATYSGDTNFSAAATSPLTLVVAVATSTTNVALNPVNVPYTVTETISASVAPSAATGTITFRDGQLAIGTATLVNGSASITLNRIGGGTHAITAAYSGDANVGGSISTVATLTVTPLVIPVALNATPATVMYGGMVNFTATLAPPTNTSATGSIAFMDGATLLATMPVNAQQATASFSTLLPGMHQITATYSGDMNFAAVVSSAATVTVNAGNSTTTLTATPPQSTPGANFVLTSNVVPTTPATGEKAPTGSVVFSDSTGTLATVPLANGAASLTQALSPLGNHVYTATYSGDADFTTSAATATVVIKQLGSTSVIAANPTSGTFGSGTYSFTATVTPAANTPTITGSVAFNDTSTVPATALGTIALNGTTATLSGVTLGGGTHNVVAIYSGDTTFTASDTTAAPAVIVIAKAATSIALNASSSPTTPNTQVILSATATSSALGALTGTVSFYEGTTLLQTVPIASGSASTSVNNLSVGNHSYTAVYSGDTNYATNTSPATVVVSNPIAQTITLAGAPASLTYGASPFVVSATSSSGLAVTLTLSGPASIIGSTITVTGAGSITITATQSGDATHAAAPNVVKTVTVAPAALNVTTNNFSIAPGQPIPTLTGTLAGVVNNDPVSVSYSTTATSSSPAGTYPITATLGDPSSRLPNYTVTNPGGTLTIVANSQSVTFPAIAATTTYGSAPIALNATATSGLAVVYTVTGPGAISGATLAITGAGSIVVTATQPGNGVYSAATPVSQMVTASPAALTVTPANASRAFGAANPVFTGTVAGVVGSDNIAALYSTPATASSAPGTYAITAALQDPGNRLPNYTVTLKTGVLTITTSSATLSIAAVPSTAAFGAPVALTVTFAANAGGAPTGAVQILDGTTSIGSATLTNGSATVTTSSLAVGTHSISATYAGDANFAATTTATPTVVTITQAATSNTLSAQPATAAFGTAIVLSSTITNAATTKATGVVTFLDGATVLGTGTLAGGVATLSVSTFTGGAHTITANYAGDVNFIGSASSSVLVTINAAGSTTTVTGSASTGALGTAATFTAAVTSTAAGTPTGTVVFSDGTTQLGVVSLTTSGAAVTTSALSVGAHTITACYSGDSNYAASCSAAGFAYRVTTAAAATTLSVTPSTTPYGQTFAFVAKVMTTLSTPPTGSITLKSGTLTLGTATLSNVAGVATANINANSTLLGIGSFTAIATYSGDGNFAASDSSATPTSFTVTPAPTNTTEAISATQILAQGTVTFTATVISNVGTPTGSVMFMSGTTTLATATLNASGVATGNVTNLTPGSYSVVAVYAATGNFGASSSAATALSVLAPVTVSATPTSVSLAPGASTTTTVTMTPALGFTGPVTLTCTSPVSYITCTVVAPAPITGTSAVTAVATISVAATVGQNRAPGFGKEGGQPLLASSAHGMHLGLATMLFPLGALLLLPFATGRKRVGVVHALRGLAGLALLVGATLTLNGCSGSAGPALPPAGTQNVTITATADGTAVSTQIAVTVTH